MDKIILLIFAILVVFLPSNFLNKKRVVEESYTIKEFWQSTHLSLKQTKDLINNEFCNKDAKNFIACVSGVNNSLQQLGKKLSYSGSIIEVPYTSDKDELTPWFAFRKSVNIDFNKLLDELDALYDQESKKYHYGLLINGYMKIHYDPHTYLMPALEHDITYKEAPMVNRHRIGKSIKTGNFYFMYLTPESPLYEQGVRARDVIKEVNGHPVKGISTSEFRAVFMATDKVKLKLLRSEKEINLVVNSSNRIKSPNVSSKVIDKSSAVVKVDLFNGSTCDLFGREINRLNEQKISNLIVDLRGNGGGIIDSVICMSALFFDSPKEIFTLIRLYDFEKEAYSTYHHDRNQNLFNGKVYILINSDSGSASEIFAGAMRDHKRATLVGQTTFGKGSVQVCDPWRKNTLLFHCKTTYMYQLPSGFYTQNEGVTPDILVNIDNSFITRESDMFFPITVKQSVSQRKSKMVIDKTDSNDEDIELSVVKDLIKNNDLKLSGVKSE